MWQTANRIGVARFEPKTGRGLAILFQSGLLLLFAIPALGAPPKSLVEDSNLVRFEIVQGRIVARNTRFGQSRGASKRRKQGGISETLSLKIHAGTANIQYERCCSKRRIIASCTAKKDFRLHSEPTAADQPPVLFVQPVQGPCRLMIGPADNAKTFKASTLWHLLLRYPQPCQDYLNPLLEAICPTWQLNKSALDLSSQMVAAAASDEFPSEAGVWKLVEKMADKRFHVRQEADRELRALGLAAVGYLKSIRRGDVNSEQFRRLSRIRDSLKVRSSDTPQTVAVWLLGDKEAWNALAHRPAPLQEQAQRHLARISYRK